LLCSLFIDYLAIRMHIIAYAGLHKVISNVRDD